MAKPSRALMVSVALGTPIESLFMPVSPQWIWPDVRTLVILIITADPVQTEEKGKRENPHCCKAMR